MSTGWTPCAQCASAIACITRGCAALAASPQPAAQPSRCGLTECRDRPMCEPCRKGLRGEKYGPEQPESGVLTYGIIDPDYARVFTQARIIAWQYGYACLAHGSFTRDLDLLLMPWTDAAQADDVDYFAPRIADAAGLKVSGHPPSVRPHGRKTWTLIFPGFADPRWVDLSVMAPPTTRKRTAEQNARIMEAVDQYAHCYSFVGDDTMPRARAEVERLLGGEA